MKFNVLPVSPLRITSPYGKRNTGIKGASTFHKGVDLGVDRSKKETECVLTNEAVLVENKWNDYRGWYCVFVINNKYKVLYQHLKNKCTLTLHRQYPPGTVVGIIGNSSNPAKLKTAIHLHFEVHENDVPVNPEPFFYDLEEYEMIDVMNVLVGDKTVSINRILKDGENYVRLRDVDDKLKLCKVGYDAGKKMPTIEVM